MLRFPKKFATQTITLKRFSGYQGTYQRPTFDDPVKIKHCVFQPQTIYSGTNNNREVTANAIVFLYAHVSQPIPKLNKASLGSKIYFEGDEYTLKTIVENRDPFKNDLWSYELEVL